MSPFYEIIYDYKDVQESLNIIMQDPVLEADTEAPADAPKDTNDQLDNTASKTNFVTKLEDTIKKLIERLIQAIDTAMLKMKNSLQKIYLTDKGFKNDVAEWKKAFTPLKAVKLVSYDYNQDKLDNIYSHIDGELAKYMKCFDPTRVEEEYNPINQDLDTIMKDIVSHSGITDGDTIDNSVDFFNQVKKEFRGPKGEHTYVAASLDQYVLIAGDYNREKSSMTNRMAKAKNDLIAAKNSANSYIHNENVSDDLKRKMDQQLKKLASVYNFYLAFMRLAFELQVERMLAARAIVRKLFQK